MTLRPYTLSPLTPADYPALERIQHLAYTGVLIEELGVLTRKAELAPQYCFAVHLGTHTVGYILAHPWSARTSPGLDIRLDALPQDAPAVHIHDVALDPAHAAKGLARALVEAVVARARQDGRQTLTLVAVQGAHTFWQHMGFAIERAERGYDAVAVFMRRDVGGCDAPPHEGEHRSRTAFTPP